MAEIRTFLCRVLLSIKVPRALLKDVILVNQSWPSRLNVMREIIKTYFTGPIAAIEVGTWFGEGSTKIWLEQLPSHSTLLLVDSWRPYISTLDKKEAPKVYTNMDSFHTMALNNTLNVIDNSRVDLDVIVVRSKFNTFAKQLQEGAFDFVYIDGSHYYRDMKEDIAAALRVANKKFSVICGDDLEVGVREDLLELAKQNVERDFIQTPTASFHPGVMIAVHEAFKQVNCTDGFWWVFCVDGEIVLNANNS
jgi:hypothetical protein